MKTLKQQKISMRKKKGNCLRSLSTQMKVCWSMTSWVLTTGILQIPIPIPWLASKQNMRNIVDDIIKKTIDNYIQETITITLPDLQSNDDNEFRSVTLDSDNNDIIPEYVYLEDTMWCKIQKIWRWKST